MQLCTSCPCTEHIIVRIFLCLPAYQAGLSILVACASLPPRDHTACMLLLYTIPAEIETEKSRTQPSGHVRDVISNVYSFLLSYTIP